MIKYTTKTNDNTKPKSQDLGYQIIFFALNFLAVPFSAYQTYKGYQDVAAGDNEVEKVIFPAILALISALLFFGLNYLIMDLRRNGKPHFWQTFGYIIPLGISFFGNFNSIYSNQMKGSLIGSEITKYQDILRVTYADSKEALNNSTGLIELRFQLDDKLKNLKSSYKGTTGASGWGTDCENSWKQIQTLLDETEIKLFIKDYSVAETTANSKFETKKSSREMVVNPVINEIDTTYNRVNNLIKKAKVEETLSIQGNFILDELRIANNQIGANTKSFLEKKAFIINPNFEYVILEESNETQIGTIKHTLNSAFVKWEQPTATVFALFFSLIIDLAVLIYIFLAYSYNKKRGLTFGGPRQL